MITYAIDLVLINFWLNYRNKVALLEANKREILNLLAFHQEVPQNLIYMRRYFKRGGHQVGSEMQIPLKRKKIKSHKQLSI